MSSSLYGRNPIVIIQARTSSTRFPRKVVADIHGKYLLEHVIRRAKKIRGIHGVILATTDRPEDDIVALLADKTKVGLFRGSVDDVLDRYYQVACASSADPVIRITGDCPLLDPVSSSMVLCHWALDPRHLVHNCGPKTDGHDTEVLPFHLLQLAWVATRPDPKDTVDMEEVKRGHREHVTTWIKDNMVAWVRRCETPGTPGGVKLSVDLPEDLERVAKVMARGAA